jgi:hypothetical protein
MQLGQEGQNTFLVRFGHKPWIFLRQKCRNFQTICNRLWQRRWSEGRNLNRYLCLQFLFEVFRRPTWPLGFTFKRKDSSKCWLRDWSTTFWLNRAMGCPFTLSKRDIVYRTINEWTENGLWYNVYSAMIGTNQSCVNICSTLTWLANQEWGTRWGTQGL